MSRRNRNKQAGQALIFGVVTLSLLLMGIAGMGIDMGYLRYQKRLQQTAADAAAIAGASNLAYGGVAAAAQAAAATNGFTDSSGNTVSTCTGSLPTALPASPPTVCVQINNPPASGPHSGDANYVEAYVSVVQPAFFMRLLGTNSEPITARAVATDVSGASNSNGCLYTLGPPTNKIEGVNITGSAEINAPTCGIDDNGNYDPTGGTQNLIINAATFGVAGSDTGHGGNVTCSDQSSADCPTYKTPTSANPEAALTAPAQPAASASCAGFSGCQVSTSNTTTLQPGTYSSIDFGKNSVTTLAPGIYYIDGPGGVTFEGKATVTDNAANGVMFYFTCPPGTSPCTNGATLNAVGGGNVPDLQLTAPSTLSGADAQYNGILFYQDPNDTNPPSLGGDNNTTLNGVLYFPTVELNFFGNDSFSAGIVIAQALSVTGNPTVTLQGAAALPTGVNFVKNAVLVE